MQKQKDHSGIGQRETDIAVGMMKEDTNEDYDKDTGTGNNLNGTATGRKMVGLSNQSTTTTTEKEYHETAPSQTVKHSLISTITYTDIATKDTCQDLTGTEPCVTNPTTYTVPTDGNSPTVTDISDRYQNRRKRKTHTCYVPRKVRLRSKPGK